MILQRFKPIFSRKNSKLLWREINKVKNDRTHDALYSMGCLCQKLETVVEQLEERISELEKKE